MCSSVERDAWFKNVKNTVKKQLQANVVANLCVFQVPKSLRSVAPAAYAPQMVSLGPYHHLRPEVREMERVKLDATCWLFKKTNYGSFTGLIAKLSEKDLDVRASYEKLLEMDNIQLAWIMTVDSVFLFDFLCRHSIGKETLKSSEWLQDLAKPVGWKLAEDAILRDVMMLENQIPFFFMVEMLKLVWSALDDNEKKRFIEDIFPQMLVAFCEALSPIEVIEPYRLAKAWKRAHLLDLLYAMVVPQEDMVVTQEDESCIDMSAETVSTESVAAIKETGSSSFNPTTNTISSYGIKVLEAAKKVDLPGVQPFAQMAKVLLELPLPDLRNALLTFRQKAPVADDTLIPRASHLAKAGITFCKTKTIADIEFNKSKAMFHLPVIQVDVNTEVIVRNLVAYEVIAMSNSHVFARYAELMSGLIHTTDDVKLLKESNILKSHLKDDDVKSIFNGASKPIQLTSHAKLDRTIMDVRKFYNDSLKAKVQIWMRKSRFRFWTILAILAILLYVLLIALQSFCSAYNCARLRITGSST